MNCRQFLAAIIKEIIMARPRKVDNVEKQPPEAVLQEKNALPPDTSTEKPLQTVEKPIVFLGNGSTGIVSGQKRILIEFKKGRYITAHPFVVAELRKRGYKEAN
jgi:hypothetical protein